MPILNEIMDHAVFGPLLREGMQIGLEQGRQEGARRILLRQVRKRFGPLPAATRKHIEVLSASKLEGLALRLLDARSLGELLD